MRGKGDGPYFLYAHSMGGAVGALYVKAHPDAFRGAVFTSPMIRAQTAGLPIWAAGGIAQAACLLGLGGKMVFIHKIYDPESPLRQAPPHPGRGLGGTRPSGRNTPATATTAPATGGSGRR